MAVLPPIEAHETFRVRRWDVVVLGGALPGLIAAVRLGMRGHRVLLLEEDAARSAFRGLREPFLMTGSGSEGVLGPCLVALGIPLIDRRRVAVDPRALQVALPNARVDIGDPAWTAEELESWGFAPATAAERLVDSLLEQSEAEVRALLETRLVVSGRGLPGRARGLGRSLRGSSDAAGRTPASTDPCAGALSDDLRRVLDAALRALTDVGARAPGRARTRLLGAALRGAAVLGGSQRWLADLLRDRIERLFGEQRTFGGRFDLVGAGNLPAVALEDSEDVVAGRVLVLNAPVAGIRARATTERTPAILDGPAPTHRRFAVHLRGHRAMLPEGMAPRLVWAGGPDADPEVVTVRVYDAAAGGDGVDVVATALARADSEAKQVEDAIAATVARLTPLAREAWVRAPRAAPGWDCDGWLTPPDSAGWPEPVSLRPLSRLPAYVLDRAPLAALGFEGDLLLGWQAGDAIADDLE